MPPEGLELDSDSDSGSDYSVTQTQLGVIDGPLESQDESNPLVSRLGGQVAWLPSTSIPPMSVSICLHCSEQMELLVQIFAPLDDSPFDRLLLVWGCTRRPCQKQGKGSVRAIRVLSFNARWEAKLEKRRQRQEAKAARLKKLEEERAAKEREDEARRKKNPFTSSGTKIGSFGGGIFGNETNPFASVTSAPKEAAGEETSHPVTYDHESDDESAEDEEDTLAEELAMKASIESSERQGPDWAKEAPAYLPAQYLNTYAEPSSSARTYEESKESKAQLKKLKESGGIGEMKGWEAERYESMMVAGIDETFERFVKRVSPHGKQVVRYEFGGIPLPFHAKGPVYNKLWVPNWPTSTTVSGQAFKNTIKDASRVYSSDAISPCSACGSRRVFELQLMPNLVNTLRPSSIVGGQQGEEGEEEKDAEKRKRREIEEAIGHKLPDKPDSDGITRSKPWKDQTPSKLASRSGLQWSTAMVFVCEKDCRGSKSSKGEIWSEEVVELQFEHE